MVFDLGVAAFDFAVGAFDFLEEGDLYMLLLVVMVVKERRLVMATLVVAVMEVIAVNLLTQIMKQFMEGLEVLSSVLRDFREKKLLIVLAEEEEGQVEIVHLLTVEAEDLDKNMGVVVGEALLMIQIIQDWVVAQRLVEKEEMVLMDQMMVVMV